MNKSLTTTTNATVATQTAPAVIQPDLFRIEYKIANQPKVILYTDTLAEAVECWKMNRNGRDANGEFTGMDFGASDIRKEPIVTRGGKFVAKVSYNCRLWLKDGSEYTPKEELCAS